jgi:hypothetical protein
MNVVNSHRISIQRWRNLYYCFTLFILYYAFIKYYIISVIIYILLFTLDYGFESKLNFNSLMNSLIQEVQAASP